MSERKLNEAHKQRLLDNGISEEIIEKSGAFSVYTPEEIHQLTGIKLREGSGIAFPYAGETDFIRIRLDVPQPDPDPEKAKKGKKMKYISPRGAGCRLYVPPRANIEAETVVITEGEKKTLAAVSRNINCLAVAGIDAWRERGLLGEKLPPAEALLPRLRRDWSGQKIILIYDSDIDQYHERWEAFPTLAEVLYSLGAEEVKIVTLPKPEELRDLPKDLKKKFDGKIGLDDFFVAIEAAGGNAVEEFWKIVERQDPWVPINCIKAVENFARCRLISNDVQEKVIGAAACLLSGKEALLIQLLQETGIRGELKQAIRQEAEEVVKAIKERQLPKRPEPEKEEIKTRTIAEAFPPAAEVLPPDFPFPDAGKGSFYDIRDNKIVKVYVSEDEKGKRRESEYTVCDAPVFLIRRVVPVEVDTGIEKWRVTWWERDLARREADIPASWVFDVKKVNELINVGIPVSSISAPALVEWLHKLRCLAVLGQDGAPALPTVYAVNRCGWHELKNEMFFVFGREIIRPTGETSTADTGDREEIQPDAGEQTDADIWWAEDISAMERQILSGIRCAGDPKIHKKFLLETAVKYPQVAFGLGCAAAAPLLRFARQAGLLEVNGFSVLMVPRGQGRSRHQGKSTWNSIIASLFGCPITGAEGRLRYSDQTAVARNVLFSVNSDMTVHLEDLQYLTENSKKASGVELANLFQVVSHGVDRERGARSGGGRRTRTFFIVFFGTAEVDVTFKLAPETGAHDRVMKLPPLLEMESDENAQEAERMLQTVMENYGHAGRESLKWLTQQIQQHGTEFISEDIKLAIEMLREKLPRDGRRATAWRLASRAGVALSGLGFLIESWGIKNKEIIIKIINSFIQGWKMVIDGISEETVASRAIEALADFVTANQESIEGLRSLDAKGTPARWVGAVTTVRDDVTGQDVEVVAMPFEAFAEAVSKEPYALDPTAALQSLVKEGYVITRKRSDNKRTYKLQVRIANTRVYCVCIPLIHLGIEVDRRPLLVLDEPEEPPISIDEVDKYAF